MTDAPLRQLKSCGVILFRRLPDLQFLLMKHPDRLDLPKGHIDPGESELECALRETEEETGIRREAVRIDERFRYQQIYYPRLKRFGGEKVEKTLVVFLGWLDQDHPIIVTEHHDFEWIDWNPPHNIQPQMINPLLAEVEHFFHTALQG